MNTHKDKIDEILSVLRSREEDRQKNTVLWILAIIGAAAAIVAVAYAVYRFFAPDYLEDFEDDFSDEDFEDFFENEESADTVADHD